MSKDERRKTLDFRGAKLRPEKVWGLLCPGNVSGRDRVFRGKFTPRNTFLGQRFSGQEYLPQNPVSGAISPQELQKKI